MNNEQIIQELQCSFDSDYGVSSILIENIKRILKENEELKQITNSYDVICKTDVDYILVANKSYFDDGIFKNNLIHISKIIDLKRYYEEQAEETKIAYGKLRNISNLYRIYR